MADKQVITVFGATGNQGGSVVKTFLEDPELKQKWTVRAVTRDVTKDSAKKLAAQGAEVVAADTDDTESLVKAIQGSHTVFAVTNYWAHLDTKKEIQQGKNLADAAKTAGVQHFIWSTLKDITKLSNGVLVNVYHFDSKAQVSEYVREIGLPATFFLAGLYMTNYTNGSIISPNPGTGGYSLFTPIPEDSQVPVFDPANDTGKFVRGIVKAGPTGKEVLAASGYLTQGEIFEIFKKVFPEEGSKATYVQLPHDVYKTNLMEKAGFPDFVALELLENMRLLNEFGYFGRESLDESIALAGGKDQLTTMEEHFKNAPIFKDLK